ncbi:hypothetical protein ACWDE9_01490 [Streptomyces olivaceoviridis]
MREASATKVAAASDQAAATEAAALRRARLGRAARESGTSADVPQSAALRDTA